ncbi:HAD-IA family hydrolase [Nocardia sp. 2]|uniref:HAD-IA family hydrolase n=1 Tax=Nocardia acididurans TaxID=2802282 RepID=A0ABS1M7K0_9NOCA|nr:HAD-IA family hydrolase [Nocardia acididurans]MBL1076622.1 HAD-IA family hydrolase [Nocardia acididurans]
MAIEAVLFDFSGTVFRLEESALRSVDLVDADGRAFDPHEVAEIMRRMTAPVEQFVEFDEEGQFAWERRDLDPELHRKAYVQVLRQSGVPDSAAVPLYEKLLDPYAWTPYPDTGEVFETLHAQGLKVGIVSNIAFDIRPAFASRGWDRYIGDFALSFEIGVMKPDPLIFRTALDRLGIQPENALMIGDSLEADGGAKALGCAFELVEALPTADRPDALLEVIRNLGS